MMDDVTDLNKERLKRDGFCHVDVGGETWFRYLVAYEVDGKEFSIDIHARNEEEAIRHVAALAKATLQGQIHTID